MTNWRPLLEKYLSHSRAFAIGPPPPASNEDLAALAAQADALGLDIDPEITALLTLANGTSFDSLRFYGANIGEDDELGRLDFHQANVLVEERGDDTLFGEWQDEFFVSVRATGKFARRSKVTGDEYQTYATCGELIFAVLKQECDLLDDKFPEGK